MKSRSLRAAKGITTEVPGPDDPARGRCLSTLDLLDERRLRGKTPRALPLSRPVLATFWNRADRLLQRTSFSDSKTGGCEESAAAQARDVHGLAALDDRAPD